MASVGPQAGLLISTKVLFPVLGANFIACKISSSCTFMGPFLYIY